MKIRSITLASLVIPAFLLLSAPANAAAPGIPAVKSPANNGIWQPKSDLTWDPVTNAARYELQIVGEDKLQQSNLWSYATSYSTTLYRFGGVTNTYFEKWKDQQIAWRVRACNAQNECGGWSQSRYARVRPVHATPTAPAYGTTTAEHQPTFKWQFDTIRNSNHWFKVYVNGQKVNPDAPMLSQRSGQTSYEYKVTTNLSSGTKTWYVQACRTIGGSELCSTSGRTSSLTIQ